MSVLLRHAFDENTKKYFFEIKNMSIANCFLKEYEYKITESPQIKTRSETEVIFDLNTKIILKTGDLIIQESDIHKQFWKVRVQDIDDISGILRIDDVVRSYIDNNLNVFTDMELNENEKEVIYFPSLSCGNVLKICTVEGKKMTTFDPFKLIISNERLQKNVTIKAALKPCFLEYLPRVSRFRLIWNVVQAMIVDENETTECVLEPDV